MCTNLNSAGVHVQEQMFQETSLTGFSRINLIYGLSQSGKTTTLEALKLFSSYSFRARYTTK